MIFFEEQKCSLGSKMQNKHKKNFLDKGFPKGGGGVGGSTFGKNSQIISGFFLERT